MWANFTQNSRTAITVSRVPLSASTDAFVVKPLQTTKWTPHRWRWTKPSWRCFTRNYPAANERGVRRILRSDKMSALGVQTIPLPLCGRGCETLREPRGTTRRRFEPRSRTTDGVHIQPLAPRVASPYAHCAKLCGQLITDTCLNPHSTWNQPHCSSSMGWDMLGREPQKPRSTLLIARGLRASACGKSSTFRCGQNCGYSRASLWTNCG